jgi:hypothetical protein
VIHCFTISVILGVLSSNAEVDILSRDDIVGKVLSREATFDSKKQGIIKTRDALT